MLQSMPLGWIHSSQVSRVSIDEEWEGEIERSECDGDGVQQLEGGGNVFPYHLQKANEQTLKEGHDKPPAPSLQNPTEEMRQPAGCRVTSPYFPNSEKSANPQTKKRTRTKDGISMKRGREQESVEEGDEPSLPRSKEQHVACFSKEEAFKFFEAFTYTGKGQHTKPPSYTSATSGTSAAPVSLTDKTTAGSKICGNIKSKPAGRMYDGIQKERKKNAILSAKDRFKDAYKRVAEDHPWVPPKSPHGLLQESYFKDPWKILIICLLCNRTRGQEVEKILEQLFSECPSAEETLHVPEDKIKEIIRPLGLHNKRTRYLKEISAYYVGDWAYVTQIPRIGKYAADAYAIFCNGCWKDVSPVDHKLELYWKFLFRWELERHPVE